MPPKRIAFVLMVLGLCVGCSERRQGTASLAIIELVHNDRKEIVYLPSDYGFLIQWIDYEEPEFYLYSKPSQTIQVTSNFETFLAGLQAFPSGEKVDRIRGCAITEQGMPEEYKARLSQIVEARRFRLTDQDDGNFPVCECETFKVRRYRSADERPKVEGLKIVDYNRR